MYCVHCVPGCESTKIAHSHSHAKMAEIVLFCPFLTIFKIVFIHPLIYLTISKYSFIHYFQLQIVLFGGNDYFLCAHLLVARITHRRVIRGLKFSKFCIFLAFVPFLTKIAKIVKKYSFIHILEQMTMTIILFIHPLIYLTISKYSFIHCFKIFLVLSHPAVY